MVVCLCSCVSEAEIIREIKNGYDTVSKLADRLNVTRTCGTCLDDIEQLIAKHKIDKQTIRSLEFIQITG
jgi:bacterioferritin-associated ferredoxin